MSALHMTPLGTLVRPHGESVVTGRAPQRGGPLAASVTRTRRLAEHLLHVLGHVLAVAGLLLIGTLSADAAHDLCTGIRTGRSQEPRPPRNGEGGLGCR